MYFYTKIAVQTQIFRENNRDFNFAQNCPALVDTNAKLVQTRKI